MKNHIIGSAKAEVWQSFLLSLEKTKIDTPHADFYAKHTKVIVKKLFVLPKI